ncbi:MAG: 2-succinyl-5-enolpyruvyl-6-hydroxy-3-cyclohexene-1-carboxylic-acid synthase [Bacteroidaceae bacterium]
MYSQIESINILTALLLAHGIRDAVVCPGSHNAPIVHNLNECGMRCVAVTDERSAGFCAMGMALHTNRPVAVCVTSGSALLGLLPAVAEAYYQHVPLVVVSADRPQAWIGQLDGQTMPQPEALVPFSRYSVSLPEVTDERSRWHCNRLVNEALLATCHHGRGPVHINLPLSEPLHVFSKTQLPEERIIRRITTEAERCRPATLQPLEDVLARSRKPMLIVGQCGHGDMQIGRKLAETWERNCVVLKECLGPSVFGRTVFEPILTDVATEMMPDLVIYMGGTLVSKQLKRMLRNAPDIPTWVVNADGSITDVTMHTTAVVETRPENMLEWLANCLPESDGSYMNYWKLKLSACVRLADGMQLPWSQAAVVRALEHAVGADAHIAYANSSAVRLGNLFASGHRACNRGLNGIEGSLSTAVGMALADSSRPVYCVIGDLSFFYDHNALWIQELPRQLRIVMLNNSGGGIFERFEGLRQSAARERLVMARHHTSAQGICHDFGIGYQTATDADSLEEGIRWITCPPDSGPRLLEVATSSAEDQAATDLIENFIRQNI